MEKSENIKKEVDRLYRELYGKLVASLVSFFQLSKISLAEDIVQDTFYTAIGQWHEKGLPTNPKAWLFRVCKNKTINALRRKDAQYPTFRDNYTEQTDKAKIAQLFLPHQIRDSRLRLLFATCHPNLSPKSQIILTLKTSIGFRMNEIAKALDMKTEAVKKSLTRAKRQLREQKLPLNVPFVLQSRERLNSVHRVLYLLFNEGYSASNGASLIRRELCLEATRLLKALLGEPHISNADTQALYALMLFNIARFDSRVDQYGIPVELESQDRSQWDQEIIRSGIVHFNEARKATTWSSYHLEAGIASLHCSAASFQDTRWDAVLGLYNRLLQLNSGAHIQLNRSIALFYSGNRGKAIDEVEKLKGMEHHHLYFATLAKMYALMGEEKKAIDYYLDALSLTQLEVARTFIQDKIRMLKGTFD
ncbi:sigma-70 family RNA polymerase sigma factor [Flavobacteriaceae bacterium TP-CH-4]|uniref:Sigma-70 family RNA polymerase sigma factor n=1 Tax=Pelagihabitans pacificus TaxID=2696054 RepID=A0A967E5J7_9FLAO|nr:sigma-70 family RNA polymerase sigma factor [Pelagihabitans pacificus]NHF58159.1 sigma-70 family RNA polymerase sigma factor [Pelagihabitans pacificus]